MILNDYKCPRHGIFEGSHPICPEFGCNSQGVEKVFLKVNVKSAMTARADAGFKKSAEIYQQTDWKTAKEGELAKANNRADLVKWGDEGAKFLGKSPTALPRDNSGAGALSMVQSGAPDPIKMAERTQESAVTQQRDRQKLIEVAKEARAK